MAEKEPKTGAEMQAMRKRRNIWVLGMIFGLALLFYFITIFRMGITARRLQLQIITC